MELRKCAHAPSGRRFRGRHPACFQVSYLPVHLLAALTLAGLALRRRTGPSSPFWRLGSWPPRSGWACPAIPLAALKAGPSGGSGPEGGRALDPDDEGWSAPARVVRLRQGDRVSSPSFEVILHLPDPEELPPAFGTTLRVKGYLARSPGFANRLRRRPDPGACG